MTGKVSENVQHVQLDADWVKLIICARDKGLSPEEVLKILSTLRDEQMSIIQESAV
ncbi:hypothetical protein [Paenibacillus oryzae]|uniref:hypothetical protein n=1 Tax=Paenibacillus oryzae TaxID=1844972 RepID=UPI0012E9B494|nr:hypothetical protein [Paenibacillus oryzae]